MIPATGDHDLQVPCPFGAHMVTIKRILCNFNTQMYNMHDATRCMNKIVHVEGSLSRSVIYSVKLMT